MSRLVLLLLCTVGLAACGDVNKTATNPTQNSNRAAPVENSTGVCSMDNSDRKKFEYLRNPVPSEFRSITPPDLTDADLIAKGKELYENPQTGNCINCHGPKGRGDGWLSSEYYDPPVADLTTTEFQNAVTDQYIYWRIKYPYTSRAYYESGMLGFPGGTTEQVWALVAYVRSLRGK